MTTTNTTRSITLSRYERLLRERITAGESMIDHLCHPEARGGAIAAFKCTERLDLRLSAYRRYPNDFVAQVMPAEDARWHTVPASPARHDTQPCVWCVESVCQTALTTGGTSNRVAA